MTMNGALPTKQRRRFYSDYWHYGLALISGIVFVVLLGSRVGEYRSRSFHGNATAHIGSGIYLDYTGAGVYSDLVVEEYSRDLLEKFRTEDDGQKEMDLLRGEILNWLGADAKEWQVIFVASTTQALKFVGERYPFTKDRVFVYTDINHNSVLGMRRYALARGSNFSAVRFPPSAESLTGFPGGLFAFPLQDNFAGMKPDLAFLESIGPEWIVVGDSAAFLPSNPISLANTRLDAIVMSFYKIFGFPNTGALVIKKSALKVLGAEGEEDPPPWELNLYVRHALRHFDPAKVQAHVASLTRDFTTRLAALRHSNGRPAAVVFGDHAGGDPKRNGGTVSFVITRPNGKFVGYAEVIKAGAEVGIHLRGGCHCNPGACFRFLELSEDQVRTYFGKKTHCGDGYDEIDGVPLGSIRASFGWATTPADIDFFINWITDMYVI